LPKTCSGSRKAWRQAYIPNPVVDSNRGDPQLIAMPAGLPSFSLLLDL